MANALNREIEPREVVVIAAKYITPGLTIAERAFICDDSGFGASSFTAGTAIFGEWYDGTGRDRVEGYWVDAKATERFQEKVGRFPQVQEKGGQ